MLFSLIFDAWTASNHAEYLGITIYYLNTNWVLNSKLFGMEYLQNRYSGSYLLQMLKNCLENYGIKNKLL